MKRLCSKGLARGVGIGAISAAIAFASATSAGDAPPVSAASPTAVIETAEVLPAKEQKAMEAGVQAVIYGLPLVLMDITMQKTTNVSLASRLARPVNQFAHLRTFPAAAFKDVVRANVDTLYSSAFLDLAKEPLVLSVPDTHGRYYLLPMLDAWTNVFATLGSRTTGTKPGNFVIAGPGWSGIVPRGMQQLKSPTNMVWILGRTQTNGPGDYSAVHSIQDGYTLVPLSQYGKPYTPPGGTFDPSVDMKTPPIEQVQKMSPAKFFGALARLLKTNPPPAIDAPILEKLARIGIKPGQEFDASKLDPSVGKGLESSVSVALEKLQEIQRHSGTPVNGWHISPRNLGNYGTDYGTRAVIALIAFGANLPADAVYPTTYVDSANKPLNGANRYVLHFDKGLTPPVNAFWSVTMYNSESFFVNNPINRYAISSWMPLRHNSDGSIDVYVQHESPEKDNETNWLPAPEGAFNITMRMYWPKSRGPSINDGTWVPPAVARIQ